MFLASFAPLSFSPLGLMRSAVRRVGKNIYMNIAVKKTLNYVENKAIGVYEKDCLKDTVGNAYVVGKQNLSSWRLTM